MNNPRGPGAEEVRLLAPALFSRRSSPFMVVRPALRYAGLIEPALEISR
jgi:hypothetical protein